MSLEGTHWRLLDTGPAAGAYNMALDDAILACRARGQAPPTLRFYAWRPPALSLGRFQRAEGAADVRALERLGIDLVRRPTGGRAVLHDREVTYSVVVSEDSLGGSVLEAYLTLSEGLVAGLERLGVEASLYNPRRGGAPGHGDRQPAACFEIGSAYEVAVAGKKLVGSAQVRRDGAVLQHGSILLELRAKVVAEAMGVRPDRVERAAARLRANATSLAEVMGRVPEYGEVASAIAAGFSDALGVALEPGGLTDAERELAEKLRRSYEDRDWTLRRPGGKAGSALAPGLPPAGSKARQGGR